MLEEDAKRRIPSPVDVSSSSDSVPRPSSELPVAGNPSCDYSMEGGQKANL